MTEVRMNCLWFGTQRNWYLLFQFKYWNLTWFLLTKIVYWGSCHKWTISRQSLSGNVHPFLKSLCVWAWVVLCSMKEFLFAGKMEMKTINYWSSASLQASTNKSKELEGFGFFQSRTSGEKIWQLQFGLWETMGIRYIYIFRCLKQFLQI